MKEEHPAQQEIGMEEKTDEETQKNELQKEDNKVKDNELKKQYDDLKKRYDELRDAAKLLAADFDNYRKRVAGEKETEYTLAVREVMIKLLPTLDNFALCLNHAEHHEEFVKAVQLLYAQFVTAVEDIGIKPIPAINQKFDPKYHEALMFMPSKQEETMIVEELQKGYMLNGQVIRTSKVKVRKFMEG